MKSACLGISLPLSQVMVGVKYDGSAVIASRIACFNLHSALTVGQMQQHCQARGPFDEGADGAAATFATIKSPSECPGDGAFGDLGRSFADQRQAPDSTATIGGSARLTCCPS